MHRPLDFASMAGAVIVAAGLVPFPPAAPVPRNVAAHAVRLASADAAASPLGGGIALVIGPSGISIPSPSYIDAADSLYLAPLGFTGPLRAVFQPNGLYPDTGVKSLPLSASLVQDQQILDSAIHQVNADGMDATDPVVVFGWSQGAQTSSNTMSQLAAEHVPSNDVHFVLIGDTNAPNGGLADRFEVPGAANLTFPSMGFPLDQTPTPSSLFPTDVYTFEYDGFADFPQYPIDTVSDLNALAGQIFAHGAYLGLTAEQLTPVADGGDTVQLATSAADTMTNYYMIENPQLPLLQPLQLLPVIGQPLYDLLEPDARILVNLGYGSISDGWSQGDADVATPFGLFPTDIDPSQVVTALDGGLQMGIKDATAQLQDPDNYKPTSITDNPALSTLLVSGANALGLDSQHASAIQHLSSLAGFFGFPTAGVTSISSPTDFINLLSGTLSADYAILLPIADTANTLLTTLPAYDASLFVSQLEAGNLLAAIGDPIAADQALVPFAFDFGTLTPALGAAVGTVANLATLFS